jgi:membrane associated rhomboid family serine protease
MDELTPSAPELAQPSPAPRYLSLPLTRPLLTWVILALNIVVWLLMTFSGGSMRLSVLVRFGAKVTWLVARGEYWRLFTAIFLHIGFVHLAFNSYALYILGPQVESLFGRSRFLVLYLLSGLAGSVASYALSNSTSAGASGAIFGLVGALVVYLVRHRDIFGRRGQRSLINVIVVIIYNLALSVMVPGIDVYGHGGGLIGGLIVGGVLCPQYGFVSDVIGVAKAVDRNSLERQVWRLILVIIGLAAGVVVGTLRWRR